MRSSDQMVLNCSYPTELYTVSSLSISMHQQIWRHIFHTIHSIKPMLWTNKEAKLDNVVHYEFTETVINIVLLMETFFVW